MKKTSRILALVVVAMMVMMMAAPAMASTLTISNSTAGFTYKAYQLFTGDKSSDKLSNIQWGTAIAAADRATFLADDDLETLLGVSDGALATKTAAEMAALFEGKNGAELADIVGKYATVQFGSDATFASSAYTFTGLPDGYYLVKNTAKDDTTAKEYTYSEYIMQVVGDTTAQPKNSSVTVNKKIDADTTGNTIDTTNDLTVNTAAIGDTIPYIIEGVLPTNFDQYDNFYYSFSDTMKGIDYVSADVTSTTATEGPAQVLVVHSDGTSNDITTHATISATNQSTAAGNTTFNVTIDNLKDATTLGVTVVATDKIVVKYWGRLNNFATTGTTANTNEVDLTYTNNPEQSGDGTSTPGGEPEYKTATGTTPKAETETYVTAIQVLKIGDNNDSNVLPGAEFKLTGANLNTVRQVSGYKFVLAPYTASTAPGVSETVETDDYYALKDTNDPTNAEKYTYTTTPYSDSLDAATKAKYVDTTNATKYKKVTYTTTVTEKTTGVTYTGYTDSTGILRFEGLNPGNYSLAELIAPAGYNLLPGTADVTITFDSSAKTFGATGSNATVLTDGTVQIKINNNSGATLPSTGGMGTTIFYVGGSILVLLAVVLLVTRRRMTGNN